MKSILAQIRTQMRATSAAIPNPEHVVRGGAMTKLPNNTKVEPKTAPTKGVDVDTISLVTTTIGISTISPAYHTVDNGLPEGNPYSSDTKDELISTSPSTILLKLEDEVPSSPNSCSATNCGTKIFSAIDVLEAETA